MLASFAKPGFDVLIPNFERVYPNIKVERHLRGEHHDLYQLETTELAAGNAPDCSSGVPGCGTPISVCVAREGGRPGADARRSRG